MSMYEKLPENMAERMTYGAGVALSKFDPKTGAITPSDILFATKGGNVFSAKRELQDNGAEIDNCPPFTKQLMKAKPYVANITGTGMMADKEILKTLLGNADSVTEELVEKITPRKDLTDADFKDFWMVVSYGVNEEGFMAYHLKNALSLEGFEATHAKDANGEFPYNFQAFYDLANIDDVPFEVFVKAGSPAL